MSVGIKTSPEAAKRLLDSLQNDLRTLSSESKRKHPDVKEAAETIQLKLRTISTKHESNIIAGLVPASSEIVRPFVLGCETKNPKLVPLCLSCVQRLISYEAISTSAAEHVIDMLWSLMETGQEELKLLQTAILLLTTNSVVQHDALSRALVLCFRLHFTKDSTTINTAAATIKQLVSAILDRVLVEDQIPTTEPTVEMNVEELKAGSKNPPKSLRPCAADAYLLFQDLCQLVNADQPFWLNGMTEMTRTFGLELLEAVLASYPPIFSTHPEFSFMLKEKVCPLVIKLFSPSLKYRQGLPPPPSPAPVEKPFFPIVMRLLRIVSILIKNYYTLLVTECEIFLSLLVKFLEPEKPMWQRCLALEVLHKLSVQPELVRSFCESYDMKQHSTKIFRDIINALGAFIQSQFMNPPGGPATQSGSKMPDTQGTPPAMVAGMPVGSGVSPQPAFMYRGVWIPLVVTIPTGQTRSVFLEMLDKIDHPLIPDGYGVSIAFYSLLEMVSSVRFLVLGEVDDKGHGQEQVKGQRQPAQVLAKPVAESDGKEETVTETTKLNEELINSSWCGMLAALSLLLDASTDESATEAILKSQESYAYLCGHLGMTTPRDAFITALCKASLPPHYTLTILNSHNTPSTKALNRTPSQDLQYASESVERSQVVAVGTALPTASMAAGSHQGTVMLTAKNIQVMRALLSLAHCHGGILGTAWHLVLTTLQHLVWILGLKPSSGGSLKASQQISEATNTVITTAVMADLPVLSAMLSRLFESSQYLDDVALHHLIDALCKLSMESMEVAFSNREPSLFAVAKLLETGLVNVSRLEVLWRPVTAHLLEVCQHPHGGLRNWAAEAVTSLVKAVLNHKFDPPLHQNVKLQISVLAPLQELSGIPHGDIRQRQLDCVLQVLHSCGDTLQQGWPLILGVIGAVSKDHNEKLVQMAFQCLQLVVTDYLPVMGSAHLEVVVEVAARFGLQTQELNVSLTAIGLLWNISDNFFQNRQRIKQDLDKELAERDRQEKELPPFDALWMCLFRRLGDLCVDSRPAVRKSAGQTLFSTVSAHGGLLQKNTWRTVLWKVLFPLLENVKKLSSSASTSRDEVTTGNILIHHSRDTAEKQWAETRVLSLAGVARTFNAKRRVLQQLGDFPRAWSLLLEYIETSALCRNAEVSLAALKSFQEILQITRDGKDRAPDDPLHLPHAMLSPPSVEEIQRSDESTSPKTPTTATTETTISDSADNDIPLWSAAWRVWLNIGTNATRAPDKAEVSGTQAVAGGGASVIGVASGTQAEKMYVPSQHFLTALLNTFPPLFEHIKARFVTSDLQQFSRVLHAALAVPVHGDASPFIIPSYPEVTITPLQEASLQAMDALVKAVRNGGSTTLQSMYPDLLEQLLTCATFGVQAPSYGAIQAKSFGSVKGPQVDWVTMNFVPFSERSLEMVVEVYREACSQQTVIQAHVLQNILKMLRLPLGLKYDCPSASTWQEAVSAFHAVLAVGLPVARKHVSEFEGMWHELGLLLEDFLFTKHPSPPTLSMEDFSRDEAIDCKMVHLIRDEILPYANTVPSSFVVKVMELLNRGSIHSAMSDTFVDTDSSRKLREDFAKTCFETLLQFSFVSKKNEEGGVTKVAVLSLLQRCQEVVKKYVEDERLSGKCPLPRPRLAEITAVLKAITTLLQSLKKAPSSCVEGTVWQQVIVLYPALVECTTSSSPHVTRALKDALHEYRDLLTPPSAPVQNGR